MKAKSLSKKAYLKQLMILEIVRIYLAQALIAKKAVMEELHEAHNKLDTLHKNTTDHPKTKDQQNKFKKLCQTQIAPKEMNRHTKPEMLVK